MGLSLATKPTFLYHLQWLTLISHTYLEGQQCKLVCQRHHLRLCVGSFWWSIWFWRFSRTPSSCRSKRSCSETCSLMRDSSSSRRLLTASLSVCGQTARGSHQPRAGHTSNMQHDTHHTLPPDQGTPPGDPTRNWPGDPTRGPDQGTRPGDPTRDPTRGPDQGPDQGTPPGTRPGDPTRDPTRGPDQGTPPGTRPGTRPGDPTRGPDQGTRPGDPTRGSQDKYSQGQRSPKCPKVS